jgi:hypothetical protein
MFAEWTGVASVLGAPGSCGRMEWAGVASMLRVLVAGWGECEPYCVGLLV